MGEPVTEFLDWVNEVGRTHPICGQIHSEGWGPGLSRKGTQEAESQHSSVSRLQIRCEQRPHARPISTPSSLGAKVNPSFLKVLW